VIFVQLGSRCHLPPIDAAGTNFELEGSAVWRPTRITLAGQVFRVGGARPDLSQKGDLPSSGECAFIWSNVADARNLLKEAPLLETRASRVLGPRGC
jgi:hypothetical protein